MKRSRSASGAPGTSSKCSVNGFYLVLPTVVSKASGLGPWEVAVQRKVCLNSSFHAGLMPLVSTDFLLPRLLVHCFPAGHKAFCVSVTHRGCFSHSRCCCSKSGNVSTLIGLDAGSTLLQRANILMGTAEMQAEAGVQLALRRGVNFHCQHQEGTWASACGGCHSSKPGNPNSGVQGSPGGTVQGPGSTPLDPHPMSPAPWGYCRVNSGGER